MSQGKKSMVMILSASLLARSSSITISSFFIWAERHAFERGFQKDTGSLDAGDHNLLAEDCISLRACRA